MSFSSGPGGGRAWDRRQEHAPGPGHVILGRHQLCGGKKRLFFALTKGNMCSDSRLSKCELLGVCVPVCLLLKKTITYWRRKWQPIPVFLPGESQGWGSLAGCSPWGCKSDGHDLATKTTATTYHIKEYFSYYLGCRL